MKKESKANLIFVSLLVLSMIPGIFLLVRKKLNGDTSSAAQPDPVPYALAYNQPPPCPPNLPRKEPLIVRQWVQRTVQEKVGIDVSMARGPNGPIVSDAYFTQLAAWTGKVLPGSDGGSDVSLWLLIWKDESAEAIKGSTAQFASGHNPSVSPTSTEQLSVPKDVRHALQDVGYIDPPEKVWLICYQLNMSQFTSLSDPTRLQIQHATIQPTPETLPLPFIQAQQ